MYLSQSETKRELQLPFFMAQLMSVQQKLSSSVERAQSKASAIIKKLIAPFFLHNVCNFIFGLILLHEVCKMSLRLLLPTVLVFSLFSCHQNPAGDGPVRLSLNSQTFTPESILDFVNSTRITRENALSSLQAMKASFRESYIGYELKKQLIGKSGDEIFAECERMFNAKFDENPRKLHRLRAQKTAHRQKW
jgi:hypothetical protein